MHGAIAAGAAATADAGAEILQAGGNAVDACVAACFAAAAAEPVLTSLFGAGVMLHRCPQTGDVSVRDFFATAPGRNERPPATLDFRGVDVDFGPAVQRFHMGAGAAAVPGAIPGLCSALEQWGQLPLAKVIAPACSMLREGVELTPWAALAVELLQPILMTSAAGRQQFAPSGRLLRTGDCYRLPALAETLETMAQHPKGWHDYYLNELGPRMVRQCGAHAGGWLTLDDLRRFSVERRRPLAIEYRGQRVHLNPAPSFGGPMVALMLQLLQSERPAGVSEHRQLHALCRAMQVADEARCQGSRDFDSQQIADCCVRFRAGANQPLAAARRRPGGPSSTTHVSVIDEQGTAAAVTYSYGEGNGQIIDETGIMMNNLLGEADLFPEGFHRWTPGARLSTMMCPSLLVSDGGDVTVLGTGGANRIRTALTQVLSNLIDHEMTLKEAVETPRLHFEAGTLSAEIFDREDEGRALQQLGAERLVTFDEPSLFFGGVHLVRRRANGRLEGVGDLRRGGACRLV